MNNTIAYDIENNSDVILKNWQLYLFITFLYLIITLINDKYIMTHEVYQIILSEKMESYRIDDFYEIVKRFSLYTYLALPFLIWIKITFIALLIQMPLLLKNVEVSFKEVFKIAAYANIPYIFLGVVRIVILLLTPKVEYTNDLLTLIPGALANFFSKDRYSFIAYKLFENINIYEASWIFIVYTGINKLKKIDKYDAFILTFSIWLGLTVLQLMILFYFTNAF